MTNLARRTMPPPPPPKGRCLILTTNTKKNTTRKDMHCRHQVGRLNNPRRKRPMLPSSPPPERRVWILMVWKKREKLKRHRGYCHSDATVGAFPATLSRKRRRAKVSRKHMESEKWEHRSATPASAASVSHSGASWRNNTAHEDA